MKKTVLIIDDEEHVRMLYAEELKAQGYAFVTSDGSGDALSLVEKHSPDLVILDVKLGEKSGLDVLQELRCRYASLPVILCTAYESFRHELKSIAADAYVVKSYDCSELMDKVESLLR